MAREDRLIRRAIQVAGTSQHIKWRHGAILVQGNKILQSSANLYRCDPFIDPQGATWHAEEAIIRRSLLAGHSPS